MARPYKVGLDYFPLDVSMEDEVELLEAEFGLEGFAILIKLWQKIYANGYFVEWGDDNALLFARKINSEKTLVSSVVNACFRRSLLDKELYDDYGILTSKGVQTRYVTAASQSKRAHIPFIREYNLLTPDLSGLITEETRLTPEESTQRKGKERKEKRKEKKVLTSSQGDDDRVPHREIVDLFNEMLGGVLPKVEKLTKSRKNKIRVRWHEGLDDINEWKSLYGEVKASDFLMGDKTDWKATFDWLIANDKNWVKVKEGNYRNEDNSRKSRDRSESEEGSGYIEIL